MIVKIGCVAGFLFAASVCTANELTISNEKQIHSALRVSYSIYHLLDKMESCINRYPLQYRQSAKSHCESKMADDYKRPAKYYRLALQSYPEWRGRSVFYKTQQAPVGHVIDFSKLETYLDPY